MTDATQLPVGATVGEYQVTGLLGEGGMGVVYSGVHPVIGKDVAIKVLSPNLSHTADIVARFIQEARAVNQIGHPNIIDIFAFGESPELGHYFVMPRLDGEDLRQRVERTGPIPLEAAVAITSQICDALEAAHEKGILHRDLKPDNVFLVPNRRGGDTVKILDFGIAKLSEGDSITVTRTGAPMGTPLFMSPEQWEGVNIDHRTDIYALAILFEFMITGRFPFESNSPVALMRMHCDGQPALPSYYGATPTFDQVLGRALAKTATERHATASEFLTAITSAASGHVRRQAAPTEHSGPIANAAISRNIPTASRRWLPWVLGLIVLGAATVTALVALSGGGDSTPAAAANDEEATSGDAASTNAAALVDAQEEDAMVSVSIESTPSGASVREPGGTVIGETPTTIERRKGTGSIELILELNGFADKSIEVDLDRDRTMLVDLAERSVKSKVGSSKTGSSKTGGDKTGGDKTGGDKTRGDKTRGDKTGGDKTRGDKTGNKTGGDGDGDKTTDKAGDKSGSGDKAKWGEPSKIEL